MQSQKKKKKKKKSNRKRHHKRTPNIKRHTASSVYGKENKL